MSKRLLGRLLLGISIWIGSGGIARAAAPTLDFEHFRFDARPQRVFPIVNDGDASLSVDTATFVPDPGTATDELSFVLRRGSAVVSLPQTLAVGQQLDVIVTAQPRNRIGMVSGKIVVHSNTPGTVDRIVTVTGDATAAVADIPPAVDFGAVDIDGEPATQSATIRNAGTAQLDISIIAVVSGANSMFKVSLPQTIHIMPDSESSIQIRYQPTLAHAPGDSDSAVLVIAVTGVLDGPKQAMIALQGHGVAGGDGCSTGRGGGSGSGGLAVVMAAALLLLLRQRERRALI
jgi:hypothetical protein